ncbi:unnamed protein product [Polarella glacialis]|uniref:Cilia- and flagella-associated protein 99 n=1 Tax=Polarella glacialis TaxID=89957 RepID=A0A813HLH4_POLGL|nr:unnamed protein product [Polarella glacialis]
MTTTAPAGMLASAGIPMDAHEKCNLLLKKCMQTLDSFEPKKTTVDAYIDDAPFLKDKKIAEVELKFIHQVFYGCCRYSKFLKLFVTSFLYKCPAVALRTEQTLYTVLAYLLFFRLSELGVGEFRLFLSCGAGTHSSLLALMQYCMSAEELEKWVKVEWCKHYDVDYIERDIIGKLQNFAEELRPVIEEVEFKATGTVKAAGVEPGGPIKSDRPPTEFKPFNLTRVRPRLIPEPDVVNREVKAQPVDPMIFKTSLAAIEEEKQKRLDEEKARVVQKYSPTEHFNFETHARRADQGEMDRLTQEVEAERMAECTFHPKISKKGYVPPTEDAVVRQTAASILREDALLKKKQANEYQILKRYEEDLHDASEYHRWQEQMKEKDHTDEEKRVQQRIVEMQLARQDAIEAQEGVQRRKHIVAEHQRGELQVDLQMKAKEYEVALEAKQQLVAETSAERENARSAEQKVLEERAAAAEQMRKEKEAEFEKKRKEDEQELERRKDLIRQIRALEKAPVERYKVFDPAEPPCMGLLEEMSLAELRERLKIVSANRAKETEEKRERQLDRKFEKQNELTEKAETLAKIRERAREETQQRHEKFRQQKVDVEAQKQMHREQCVQEVAEKILLKKQQKKGEELRLKKELKEIATKRQFLLANAEMVEVNARAEQHSGLDREARLRQKNLLVEQRRANEINKSVVQIRRDNQQAGIDEYKAMQQAVTERISRAREADTALKADITKASQSARNIQWAVEKKQNAEIGHSANAYIKRTGGRDLLSG